MAFGGTVKLTGESEYRKALSNITSNLAEQKKILKNEKVKALFDRYGVEYRNEE